MRKSRFTEEQIIKVLKEHAAGMSAGELCRKHGISDGLVRFGFEPVNIRSMLGIWPSPLGSQAWRR